MKKNMKDTNKTEESTGKDKSRDKIKKEEGSESAGNEDLRTEEEKLLKKKTLGEYDTEREGLDYCTKAPAPEQAGWHHDDEPCDDGRSGNLE